MPVSTGMTLLLLFKKDIPFVPVDFIFLAKLFEEVLPKSFSAFQQAAIRFQNRRATQLF
jgi:hypothetical protein